MINIEAQHSKSAKPVPVSYNSSILKPVSRSKVKVTSSHRLKVSSLPLLLLSEHTPLERCCVHNTSPFSSSGLSPGCHEAKVQSAKVCLNCMEPSVARSSCWSLPVGRYLSDTRWWSSWSKLRAIWPKSCRSLLDSSLPLLNTGNKMMYLCH